MESLCLSRARSRKQQRGRYRIRSAIGRYDKGRTRKNEYGSDANNTTFGGAQLLLSVHITEHPAVLCLTFPAGVVRLGSVGGIDTLVCSVVGHTVPAQAVDFLDIGWPDRSELFEYVLHRSSFQD